MKYLAQSKIKTNTKKLRKPKVLIHKPGPDSPPSCTGSFFYLACTVLPFVVMSLRLQQHFLKWKGNSNSTKFTKLAAGDHAKESTQENSEGETALYLQLSRLFLLKQHYSDILNSNRAHSHAILFLSKMLSCHLIPLHLMFHPG